MGIHQFLHWSCCGNPIIKKLIPTAAPMKELVDSHSRSNAKGVLLVNFWHFDLIFGLLWGSSVKIAFWDFSYFEANKDFEPIKKPAQLPLLSSLKHAMFTPRHRKRQAQQFKICASSWKEGALYEATNLHICFLNHSVPLKKQSISMIGGLECLRKATSPSMFSISISIERDAQAVCLFDLQNSLLRSSGLGDI